MSSEQDQAAPAIDRALELLQRESLSATERIERVESLLDQREAGVDHALARFAAGGERHVLADDRSEYESFLELCRAAERNGHAVAVTALVRRSLDDGVDPGALKWEIQSNDSLTDGQVAERLSLLTAAVADDDQTVGDGVESQSRDAAGPTTGDQDGDEKPTRDPATEGAAPTPKDDEGAAEGADANTANAETPTGGADANAADDEAPTDTDRTSFPAGASARGGAETGSPSIADPDGTDEEAAAAAPQRTDEGTKESGSPAVDGERGTTDPPEADVASETADSDESDGRAETAAVEETRGEPVDGSDGHVEAGATDAVPEDVDIGEDVDEYDGPADDDRHREPLRPPQRTDPTEQGAFSMPNYAQDLVQFDFVLDSDDRFVPNDVRGSGMVVVGDKQYVGIVRVKPRSWSIHTNEKKAQIIDGYKSSFLATLDFPVQIVSYPTKFDISDHVQRLSDVVEEGHTRSTDSKLVNVGRELYPNWLERFIQDNDMKQRQLYIVVPLSAHQINDFADSNDGFFDQLGDKVPPLKPVADFLSDDDGIDVTEQQCLRELDSRLSHIGSGLRRFDVEVERLADRNEVMSVLYHYYNNEQPLNDAFPTGPYSTVDAEAGTRR